MVVILLGAVLGLVFGSFASMASYRLISGQKFDGRSRCPKCDTVIALRSLVPVVSYVAQSGKCLSCSAHISYRYPLIELLTCLAFVGIANNAEFSLQAFCLYMMAVLLIILIDVDIEELIIPDILQLGLMVVGLVYAFLNGRWLLEVLGTALLSFIIGNVLFYGSKLVLKKEGLGWGDVKFFAVSGLFLDVAALAPFFFIAGLIGIVTSIIWSAIGRGPEFPFGPSLAISLYICTLWPTVYHITSFMASQ